MSLPDFYAILDECVARIRRGESAEACLADYPAHAAELTPGLVLTAELLQLPLLEPTPDAVASGYNKMMAALDDQVETSPRASLSAYLGRFVSVLRPRRRGFVAMALRVTVIVLAILVVAGGFVVTAAADTLPGDPLYPVKRAWEDTRITLTMGDESRQALQSQFDGRRREEVKAVLELHRPVAVEFKGVIESSTSAVWQVDGLEVTITEETDLQGPSAAGQEVTVWAQASSDGSLTAVRIVGETTPPPATAVPTATTRPTRPSGSLLTTRDVIEPSPSPSPTPEKTRPEATAAGNTTDRPTPEPTSTPAPSVDSEPTREPQPTNTPATNSLATAVPRPTETRPVETRPSTEPRPTPTPTPTRRTSDVAPPTPTATSRPAQGLAPSPTPTGTRNVDTGD